MTTVSVVVVGTGEAGVARPCSGTGCGAVVGPVGDALVFGGADPAATLAATAAAAAAVGTPGPLSGTSTGWGFGAFGGSPRRSRQVRVRSSVGASCPVVVCSPVPAPVGGAHVDRSPVLAAGL